MLLENLGFCQGTAPVFQFIGYALFVLKIVIPIILIVIGVVALGKAVIAADDKEIKTAVNSLIKKFLAAVLIFFLPTIVGALFGVVNGFKEVKDDYTYCVTCVINPFNGNCTSAVDTANAK